jgi:hypothetical protein
MNQSSIEFQQQLVMPDSLSSAATTRALELPLEIFYCPEESQFYSQCLQRMVFNHCDERTTIVEFGAGEGSPTIDCLLKSQFNGTIYGYELNTTACQVARARIAHYCLGKRYVIHNTDFFESEPADYLIANPPYIPALDNDLYMPALYGGHDGAQITKQLLQQDFPQAMLMISAYSDPIGTIEVATAAGYRVADFMTSPMGFGYYSSEPKVRQRIAELQECGRAFYSQDIYLLAGVLFKKQQHSQSDLSTDLIKILTSL